MRSKQGYSTVPLVMGIALLAVFALWALLPRQLAPYSPREMFTPWLGCSSAHLLGTNDMGYDILSELIFASSTTMAVGFSAAALSLALGASLGILAGFGRGVPSAAADLCINTFLLIPMLPAAIVLSAFGQPGTAKLILTIALLGWCGTARAIRAGASKLRSAGFVYSLTVLGIPRRRIITRHLLPNLSELIASRFIMSVAACIMTEATLSFVGLGDPTRVTWGGMISMAYKRGGFTRGAVNWFLAPGLCIMLTVLAFYCVSRAFELRAAQVAGSPDTSKIS